MTRTSGNEQFNPRTLLVLGVVISFPMILASGPIAGFILSRFILVKYLGMPAIVIPIFTILGFVASGIEAYRLLKKIKAVGDNRN